MGLGAGRRGEGAGAAPREALRSTLCAFCDAVRARVHKWREDDYRRRRRREVERPLLLAGSE